MKLLLLPLFILCQTALSKPGTGKYLIARWIDETNVVFTVHAPVNRLARIEYNENGTDWVEYTTIWTGDTRIQVPAGAATYTARVTCYPPTDLRGSTEQIKIIPSTTDTNHWRTVSQTNEFWKTDHKKFRMRLF